MNAFSLESNSPSIFNTALSSISLFRSSAFSSSMGSGVPLQNTDILKSSVALRSIILETGSVRPDTSLRKFSITFLSHRPLSSRISIMVPCGSVTSEGGAVSV